MKRFAHIAGAVLAILACGFFLLHLWKEHGAFATFAFTDSHALFAFLVSSLLFLAIYPITGWVSARILADLRAPLRPSTLIGILSVSQIARYIPGNIGQHLARGAMLIARGVPASPAIVSLAFEALLALLVACLLAGITLLLATTGISSPKAWAIVGIASLVTLILLALLLSRNRLLPAHLVERFSLGDARCISWRTRGYCMAAYTLNYILIGLGLYLVASSVTHTSGSIWLFIGAFALAWTAGFLAPGLPAGLGVREGVLIVLLGPALGPGPALVVATIHRLSTAVGDLLAVLLGVMILWMDKRKPIPVPTAHPGELS